LAVLVDSETNSSAEMIALSLQEHGDARVVGVETAGGLNVPARVPLASGILMYPASRALGPKTKRGPAGMRVRPDVIVANRTPEDFAARRDPQLEAALRLLANA
jgi:C-terminal processing protease CtpA/Prc